MKKVVIGKVFWLLLFIIIIPDSTVAKETSFDYSSINDLKITILYDNYSATPNSKSDWGFACLIEGLEKTILFDAGADGKILMENIEKLGVDLKKVDLMIISHAHGDHTGGVTSVMSQRPDLPVYVTNSFPLDFSEKEGIRNLIRINEKEEICKDVFTTGEMGNNIHEQSLIIRSINGLIIITGCSHQGIVNILNKASEIDKSIYLVFGGFHLLRDNKTTINDILNEFKRLGVQKCGATHCTGDTQINQFKEFFKNDFIQMGTGRIITINNIGITTN